jgi:hypothetical protein
VYRLWQPLFYPATGGEEMNEKELAETKAQTKAWIYQLLAMVETAEFVSTVKSGGTDDQIILAIDFSHEVQSICDFNAFKRGVK